VVDAGSKACQRASQKEKIAESAVSEKDECPYLSLDFSPNNLKIRIEKAELTFHRRI